MHMYTSYIYHEVIQKALCEKESGLRERKRSGRKKAVCESCHRRTILANLQGWLWRII